VAIGEGVTVEALPIVRPGMFEIVLRDCEVNLNDLLTGRNTAWIMNLDAMHVGGNTWFIRGVLRDQEHHVVPEVLNGEMLLIAKPGSGPVLRGRVPPPSIRQLIEGGVPDYDPPYALPLLTFLYGDAIAMRMDARAYKVLFPEPPDVFPVTSWAAADRARTAMLDAPTRSAETRARYELGWHYMNMRLFREARYYFNSIPEDAGPIPQREIALARAWAEVGSGHWDDARTRFGDAFGQGASPLHVIEGLALVSLETGQPARAPTARALASLTGRPEALMLAAELLQMDRYYGESLPILQAIRRRLTGRAARRVALRRGDALLMTAQVNEALHAWRDTRADMEQVRERLAWMLQDGPASWPQVIPELENRGQIRNEAGAESLYLAAQVHLVVGTREDALRTLSSLLQLHKTHTRDSDVPTQLWSLYKDYIQRLREAERHLDLATLHESIWTEPLRVVVDDWHSLVEVSDSYEAVGLAERAIQVQREAVHMLVSRGEDRPELVYSLAMLYARTRKWEEGLKSIAYLRAMPSLGAVDPAQVEILEAALSEGAGDKLQAARALRRAAMDPAYRDRASVSLAVLDAEDGRCARSVDLLERVLTQEGAQKANPAPRPWLALARCFSALGRGAEAAPFAAIAATLTDDVQEVRYAQYLEGEAGDWADEALTNTVAEGEDIWASIAQDQQDQTDLQARIGERGFLRWEGIQ